jgi:hypothetical protein
MARHASIRASDADRDAVVQRLRQAAIEGRLEAHELEQRVHAALRARTYGDLDRLLADLPGAIQRRRSVDVVPSGRMVLMLALRVAVVLVVATVMITALVLTAAWWLAMVLVWLVLRGRRGACWHAPPRARRV